MNPSTNNYLLPIEKNQYNHKKCSINLCMIIFTVYTIYNKMLQTVAIMYMYCIMCMYVYILCTFFKQLKKLACLVLS